MHRFVARVGAILLAVVAMSGPQSAGAYNYLEHTFFTDRACLETQRRLITRMEQGEASPETIARYLALSLSCPESWDKPYCVDGYKQLESGLNRLEAEPEVSGDLAATLGDFAALPDHLSQNGPVRGLSRVGDTGLTLETWRWLAEDPRDAGGVIGDVSEDACEVDDLVPWERVEHDISTALGKLHENGDLDAVPAELMTPMARAPIPKGPTDPAGVYSFDNPHYLDLVLRNHSHFGSQAYGAWVGYHSAAVSMNQRSCEQIIGFDADQLDDLADDLESFNRLDWDELSSSQRRRSGCAMMRTAVHRRLIEWAARADAELVAPVVQSIAGLGPAHGASRLDLDAVVVALSSLVMEGAGIHYLQDGLASGHMRTIRSKEQLDEVRYDHDADNRDGVAALLQTRSGNYPFVAFGDNYLLGPALTDRPLDCDLGEIDPDGVIPAAVSGCLIQHQRGLLVAATQASLLDWALGGTLYDEPEEAAAQTPESCERDDELEAFICRTLPARTTRVTGEDNSAGQVLSRLHHGSIPVPPPPFGYQALSFNIGLEATGDASQFGLHLTLLDELDRRANWLVSHRTGIRTTFGDADLNQFVADYSYGFHWRWSARFLVDARAEVFTGLRGLDEDVAFFTGLAPHVGVTALPEGWTKLPLELTLSYRLPMVFYGSDGGFFGNGFIDGHWIMFGLGLAYM